MRKKKIWGIALACFLMAAMAASQGILFAKDEAAAEQEDTAEVKNWGGVRRLYPQSLAVQKI